MASIESILASGKTPKDVDALALGLLEEGHAPDYIAKNWWTWVTITGGGHVLRILVAPDYAALGDYRLARMTPYGAQAYADYFDAILPSKKLVCLIQKASSSQMRYIDVKGAPWHVPVGDIETPQAAIDSNDGALAAFAKLGIEPGEHLTIGYKKAIVTGPNLDGSKVAIYGGIGGTSDPPCNVIQGYSNPPKHDSGYSDYSHGIVLVSRKAELDGELVDLRLDVFGSKDPAIYGLVSDQGRFDPVFPNAGPKSRAMFSGGGSAPASFTRDMKAPAPVSPAGGSGRSMDAVGGSSPGVSVLKLFGVVTVAGLLARWIFG